MFMDDRTRYLIDFDKVLSDLHPSSPFGIKCKSGMKPYMPADAEKLALELDRVQTMRDLIKTQPEIIREIKANLKQIKDIHRSVERCIAGGVLSQVELFEVKNLIFIMHGISAYQQKLRWRMDEDYKVNELPKVMELLDPQHSGIRSFFIYDEYSDRLKQLRASRAAKELTLQTLRKEEIAQVEAALGIKLKSTGEVVINKSQTELRKQVDACKNLQQSSETFINLTYRIKPDEEMASRMKDIEDLKLEELIEETKVIEQLSHKLGEHGQDILKNISAIGAFDLLLAKGELAMRHNAVKPDISDNNTISISKGVNPVVLKELAKRDKTYMPVSAVLNEGVTLITGANMGGKTISLKLMGLLTCMAQHGLLVPAEHMSFEPRDFIYISCGDEQSVDLGLSTFGAEIKGITCVIERADRRGLVLMDELARGTNPKEGYAISRAIIDYLRNKLCISVITTHLEGLEKSGVKHLQVKGLDAVDFSDITDYGDISEFMDYSLVEVNGESGIPHDAIKISKLMGMPEEIITQAEEIMKNNRT